MWCYSLQSIYPLLLVREQALSTAAIKNQVSHKLFYQSTLINASISPTAVQRPLTPWSLGGKGSPAPLVEEKREDSGTKVLDQYNYICMHSHMQRICTEIFRAQS